LSDTSPSSQPSTGEQGLSPEQQVISQIDQALREAEEEDIRLDQADLTVQIEQEQEEGPSTEEADAQDNDSQEDEGNGKP
jgi:hypothetical protein